MKILLSKSSVIENKQISEDFFLLTFENKNEDAPGPGQFINIKVNNSFEPFLRRPFAVFDFNRKYLSILFKKVGGTTLFMSQLQPGDFIEYFGFLGMPFPLHFNKKHISIIAGGTGIGGINLFANKFKKNNKIELFLGFNRKTQSSDFMNFFKKDKWILNMACREKSSSFFQGTVVELFQKRKKKGDIVFACGPQPMLQNLYTDIIKKQNMPAYFLMESIMACGIGSCMGCTLKIKEKNSIKQKRVCKDGPIFNAHEIIWES